MRVDEAADPDPAAASHSRHLRRAPGRRRGRALRRRLEQRSIPSRRAPLRDGEKINVRSLAILTRNALFPVQDIARVNFTLKEDTSIVD